MSSDKKSASSFLPFLVIALLAGGYVWFTFGGGEKPSVPAGTETPEVVTNTEVPATKPPTVAKVATDLPVTPWSTYHGDSSLTGATTAVLPDTPSRLWQFQAGGQVINPPVSDADRLFFNTYKGKIFALDFSGEKVWEKQLLRDAKEDGTPVFERIEAPSACFGTTLLIGTTHDELLAFDTKTGDDRWTYDVGDTILGTVNLHHDAATNTDRVFVIGQGAGVLHAIDLATGVLLWETEGVERCDGSPSVGNDAIVFGSCAAALHVYSTQDGALLRNIETADQAQIAGGAALVGDSIFSGSYSGALIHANLKTGETIWTNTDSTDEVFTTPAVNDAWVVFGSRDGIVYALDRKTGTQQWQFDSAGDASSPVLTADKVAFSSQGKLYLLRLATGEKLWSFEVSDEITSPAIINNMLVVGSSDGTVTAFGAAAG